MEPLSLSLSLGSWLGRVASLEPIGFEVRDEAAEVTNPWFKAQPCLLPAECFKCQAWCFLSLPNIKLSAVSRDENKKI